MMHAIKELLPQEELVLQLVNEERWSVAEITHLLGVGEQRARDVYATARRKLQLTARLTNGEYISLY